MRWIHLSPHPDDAALCAGGLIHDQVRLGEQVEIWTLMSGVPATEDLSDFARVMHARWRTGSAADTIAIRHEEDRRAAAILGVTLRHLDFLDAIYRRGPDGEPLYADPVGAIRSVHDETLAQQIFRTLMPALREGDRLVTPLAIGGHVDHGIVREAAELLRLPLNYVEDFPYVLQHPDSVHGAVAGLQSTLRPVSPEGLEAWVMAVQAYTSQLGAVFGDLEPGEAIRGHLQANGGLRLWSGAAGTGGP